MTIIPAATSSPYRSCSFLRAAAASFPLTFSDFFVMSGYTIILQAIYSNRKDSIVLIPVPVCDSKKSRHAFTGSEDVIIMYAIDKKNYPVIIGTVKNGTAMIALYLYLHNARSGVEYVR
jgi:hypothetical protein